MQIILLMIAFNFLSGLDLGKTYPIAENYIEQDISNLYSKNKVAIDKQIEDLKSKATKSLHASKPQIAKIPKAIKSQVRTHKPIYTVPKDIYDDEFRLLYKKGYSYNPLDYRKLYRTYVIFNPERNSEIKFIKDRNFTNNYQITLIATQGEHNTTTQKLNNANIYNANPQIISGFNIQKTPSIVKQKNNYFLIEEIYLED